MCDDFKGLLDTQLYKVLLNVSILDGKKGEWL